MDRTGDGEFARIESEFLDVDHADVVVTIFLEEGFHQRRRDSAGARDGEMGCPGALFDRKITSEGGFVHPLVQLKKVWMGVADSNPKDVRHPLF